jgi:hypothetical protein
MLMFRFLATDVATGPDLTTDGMVVCVQRNVIIAMLLFRFLATDVATGQGWIADGVVVCDKQAKPLQVT